MTCVLWRTCDFAPFKDLWLLFVALFSSSDDGELRDFFGPRRAATWNQSNQNDLGDTLFNGLTSNIFDCKYYDVKHSFSDSNPD